MTTIPASSLVNVIPNVLNAGGNSLVMNGLVLTTNTRVPIGQVLSFPNDGVSVSRYFGPSAEEVEIAGIYFQGFDNSTQKPAAILFARFPSAGAGAYLRGGPVNSLTIPQLKAITGTLSIVVDGYTYSNGAVNLSAATSYSSAAAIIQTALNNTLPSAASVTGAIAAGTASVTGNIAGNVLTVTAVASGTLVPGAAITGTGVTAATQVVSQLSGTTGGIGTYAVNKAQSVPDGTTIAATYGTLTVSAVASGTLSVGQVISGSGVTANTQITALGTGTGLTGTYYVNLTQTAASTTITATGAPLSVTYDSISGGFIIASGSIGAGSTVAFATGTIAAPIFLTEDAGAILSQGAAAATPAGFMTGLVDITQNWANFMLVTDPDAGNGCQQKLAFAAWNNAQNKRWGYVALDTDVTPTTSNQATTSFGYLLGQAGYNGTCAVFVPASDVQRIDAFVCGAAASIDFEATNGRITFAFKGQGGLVAGVTKATEASNLIANGYNFYGAYATANQTFRQFQNGTVSGIFQWLDSYENQIQLNNALQLALMNLLANAKSVPYNPDGYALIRQSCMDPINAALNFGSIRPNVTLSAQQASLVNTAAGLKIDDTLQVQGWYLQVKDAAPIVRQARQSPPINFWYMDGQSVQKIEIASILVQ
ncbi:DUF3383 family protein [Mesorhizobium amorphae]|uniref:DUF3383 family protein n=1 Tax=Mesorhizobium amorphae TaxID=71433 RepID=UPI001186A52E|nr:DUF3383 family protein [Mesorhizobium amorphae]